MKKLVLFGTALCSSILALAAEHTITNSGTTFTPSAITIADGDVVTFTIASAHNVREVSQATWNTNGTTALAGGFSLPNGGGQITPSVGVHYYVCVPHASGGMKGMITVLDVTGMDKLFAQEINLFPNPATDVVNMMVPGNNDVSYRITTLSGQEVLVGNNIKGGVIEAIGVGTLPRGIYLIVIKSGEAEYRRSLKLE